MAQLHTFSVDSADLFNAFRMSVDYTRRQIYVSGVIHIKGDRVYNLWWSTVEQLKKFAKDHKIVVRAEQEDIQNALAPFPVVLQQQQLQVVRRETIPVKRSLVEIK